MANVTTTLGFDLIARDKASRNVRKVGDAAEDTADSLDQMGKKADFGGKITKAAGAAGVALGALGLTVAPLGAAISQAMDIESASAKLRGQLGLTDRAARKSTQVAKDVYGRGWGESVAGVTETIRSIGTNITDVNKISKRELTRMTRDAQVLADVWGEDVSEVTRAVGDLMRNKLAKDSRHAFDIISKGFQSGANRSDDFLDTINEYSPQFRKLGISGEYALDLISKGMQAGARDTDKIADAVKEFSIRAIDGSETTAEGFRLAGLSAQQMSARIAEGGPKAEKAFAQTLKAIVSIEDPIKRDAAGVALMGTMWEDLGPTVVAAMAKANPSVEGLRGTTARLAGTVGETTAQSFERLRRKMGGWLTQIGEAALPLFDQLVSAVQKHVVPAIEGFVEYLSGPGKFHVIDSLLAMGESMLGFASFVLKMSATAIRSIGGFASKTLSVASMVAFAMGDRGMAKTLSNAAGNVQAFTDGAADSFDDARGEIDDWNNKVKNMRDVVKFKGHIADLSDKIRRAKKKLNDKDLTRTRRAELQARIDRLVRNKRIAQRTLNALRGKTVTVTFSAAYTRNYQRAMASHGPRQFAKGTRNAPAGLALVGEEGPELVRMRGGEQVYTAAQTERMISDPRPVGVGVQSSASSRQVIELRVGGNPSGLERMFLSWLEGSLRRNGYRLAERRA